MLKVGLTGGIGSGKSVTAGLFADLGAPVIDADIIARQLVEPGSDALAEIVRVFGSACLDAGGHLNRSALAGIVFNDPAKRRQLDSILHPRVRDRIEMDVSACSSHPYVIIVIPLLLEAGQTDLVDRILVLHAPEQLRLHRVIERDRRNREQILAIMASQVADAARLEAADDIIHNSGNMDELADSVERLHHKYTIIGGRG